MTDLAEMRDRYAELIVSHGLNVQEGQLVNIVAEACHRDFVMQVAEKAYGRGARFVNLDLIDLRANRLRILHSKDGDLTYTPEYLPVKFKELVDKNAANLRIIGSEDPDLLSDLDPKKMNTVRKQTYLAARYFYEEGIGRARVHWTVAAAATPLWGRKLFGDLDPEAACARLWEEIFCITRADRPDCLEAWQRHNRTLQERARRLTDMKIRELHFSGPGTDLVVGLSDKAIFKGGGDQGPHGVEFEPNLPTEEVFTTPDSRETRGQARATRPFLINGRMIEGLRVEFEDGRVSGFEAAAGEETFREYIGSDEGASRLGEVALVGVDSPVYRSGLVFEEILYDENAACHIAVGSAYKTCIEGGESMSKEELEAVGCNDSSAHTDMMISSEEVDVAATTHAGERVPLIAKGRWVGEPA
ncbi:MAG: aminopeptidase [Planctomycetota bacterium]